jgi:hypothetical protein
LYSAISSMLPGNRSVISAALPLPPKITGVVSAEKPPETGDESTSAPFTYRVARLPS